MGFIFLKEVLFCFVFLISFFIWLSWVFSAVCGLSLAAVSRATLRCSAFSLQGPPELQSTGSGVPGLQELWHVGSAALRLVESSRARDQTLVPCIGRQTFHRWTHQGSPWGGLENFKLHTDFSRRAHVSEKLKVLVACV